MSSRLFSFLIIIGTLTAWLSWLMIIFYFDPEKIGFLSFGLFYLALFLWLSGLIFLAVNFFKKIFFKNQLLYYRVRNSSRHAIFFTVLIMSWIFLKSQGLLRWWNILILIVMLTLLEFFFISYQRQQRSSYGQTD